MPRGSGLEALAGLRPPIVRAHHRCQLCVAHPGKQLGHAETTLTGASPRPGEGVGPEVKLVGSAVLFHTRRVHPERNIRGIHRRVQQHGLEGGLMKNDSIRAVSLWQEHTIFVPLWQGLARCRNLNYSWPTLIQEKSNAERCQRQGLQKPRQEAG